MNEWLQTITDESLRKDVKDTLLVTGGSICSMLLQETVNDYDIYVQDRDVLLRLINYYVDMVDKSRGKLDIFDQHNLKYIEEKYPGASERSSGQLGVAIRNLREHQIRIYAPNGGYRVDVLSNIKQDEQLPKYRPLFFSPNAISLSEDVQIVNRFFGTPEEIHKTFDFIHATNYFTFKDGVVTNIDALESILSKQLRYQGSLYPVTSIIRVKKFLKRGWNISAGEQLKIMFQISDLNLSDPAVLEDQLIGIDVAYFATLINAINEHLERNPGFVVTSAYINGIIDRIFLGELADDIEIPVEVKKKEEDIPFFDDDDLPW